MENPTRQRSLQLFIFLIAAAASSSAGPALANPSPATESQTRAAQVESLRQEVAVLQTEIHRERRESAKRNTPSSDTEIAARALKIERLLAARRALIKLSREEDPPTERAERRELQNRLAAASSPEERRAIIDQQVALHQALAMEPKGESTAK